MVVTKRCYTSRRLYLFTPFSQLFFFIPVLAPLSEQQQERIIFMERLVKTNNKSAKRVKKSREIWREFIYSLTYLVFQLSTLYIQGRINSWH